MASLPQVAGDRRRTHVAQLAVAMSDEPRDNRATPLSYATHVGEYPRLQPHPRFAVALVGLTGLSGIWTIILGVCCVDLLLFGAMLIATGACFCWATLGKLSATRMRLRPAIALLTIAVLLEIPIIGLSHHFLMEYRAQSGEDQSGRSVPLVEIIRNTSLPVAVLGVGTLVYAIARLAARRGNDFN